MRLNRRDFVAGCGCAAATLLLPPGRSMAGESMTFKNKICGYWSDQIMGEVTNIGKPSKEAVKIVTWITDSVGIRQNFKILAADIERFAKAFATIRSGQRYIVYNREDFDWQKGSASWSDISTMGHEVGHHVASHTFAEEYSQHEQELEADRFSGFAMSKLGATLEQATSRFWDWPGSASHPGGLRRKKAVEDGWKHGETMKAAEQKQCRREWLGGEVDIDGTICRMARRCDGRREITQLACKDFEGAWRWRR